MNAPSFRTPSSHPLVEAGSSGAGVTGPLAPEVRRWIWDQGWQDLNPVQQRAIEPVLAGQDVVIAAPTASGKTEAAWLPIFSSLIGGRDDDLQPSEDSTASGIEALYVAPLKALINDQYQRLSGLGEATSVEVHRWHGDVPAGAKRVLLARPCGVLLTTPESLEAMFVTHGSEVARIFAGLRYVVIDELHSFIGTARGRQVQSLLHRLELVIGRRIPRLGLSATIADLQGAADYLRPRSGTDVCLLQQENENAPENQVQIRGHYSSPPVRVEEITDPHAPTSLGGSASSDRRAIGEHLYETCRGKDNLIFANSRALVEQYAADLADLSEAGGVPNEFFAHHGSLDKGHREEVERRLACPSSPTTAVCTSTLEMGIDIGTTDAVAQIGPPPAVSALRQRLGRSGRRNDPARLRVYTSGRHSDARSSGVDELHLELLQAIAMVDLMVRDRWYEPPNAADPHLSTLIHQILSIVAERGGAGASDLYQDLCETGPFQGVDAVRFATLLHDMGGAELLIQTSDGLLLHGREAERLISHYSFYAVFRSTVEYRVMAGRRILGAMPIDRPLPPGSLIIFSGRRWKITSIEESARIIHVTPSRGGSPPTFTGEGMRIADGVRRRMHDLYRCESALEYLDLTAAQQLVLARATYRRLQLDSDPFVQDGVDTTVFVWRGDVVLNTLALMLQAAGVRVAVGSVTLTIAKRSPSQVRELCRQLAAQPAPESWDLARAVPNKKDDKYDRYLSAPLLTLAYASRHLDARAASEELRLLAQSAEAQTS